MESDEKILEYSPILHVRNKQKLYDGLIRQNYTESQVKRLFIELSKYSITYFYAIPSREEINEIAQHTKTTQNTAQSIRQTSQSSRTKVPQIDKITGQAENDPDEQSGILSVEDSPVAYLVKDSAEETDSRGALCNNMPEENKCATVENMFSGRKYFDTYHMRNRDNLYELGEDREVSEFDGLFLHAYCKYLSGEYLSAREIVENLLRKGSLEEPVHFGCRMHLLSLGAAASYKSGSYYDALWLTKAGKTLAENVQFMEGAEYFQSMLEVIEATREVKRVTDTYPYTLLSERVNNLLSIPVTLEDKISRCIQYGSEITLLRDVKIYDSREVHANREEDSSILGYINKIKGIGEKCKDISPIVIYSIEGCLAFGLIYYKDRAKMSVIKSKISVEHILSRLSSIQARNREVLKRVCNTPEEKKEWWNTRISLDGEIKREIVNIDTYLQKYVKKGHEIKKRVALVIEDVLGSIPFEMCNTFVDLGVFRSSSLSHILLCSDVSVDSRRIADKDFFYILNPERNLVQTEKRILEYIQEHIPSAPGIKNRPPLPMEAEQAIMSHRIFMYFGHGGGEKFFAPRKLRRISENMPEVRTRSIFLFGCSSAKVSGFSMYNTHSTCISYMHIPIVKNVVGALWDVTDKDLDITSIGIMDTIIYRKEPLSVALNRLKRECKLKYLNGAAIVLYGIDE